MKPTKTAIAIVLWLLILLPLLLLERGIHLVMGSGFAQWISEHLPTP